MTPPPRGRRREPDPLLANIRRRRRERVRRHRKRVAHFVVGTAIANRDRSEIEAAFATLAGLYGRAARGPASRSGRAACR